jgi:8-oxo-dGTP diphosphatase
MKEPVSTYSHVEPINRPSDVLSTVSIDNVIFGLDKDRLQVLLVRHGEGIGEGEWGLPGGWILREENLRDAAIRLLNDLTGIDDVYLEQLKTFGRVDRFPNERVITVAYYALVSAENYQELKAGFTAAEAKWFAVNEVPALLYDHSEILKEGFQRLKYKVRHEPLGFNLLPKKFTLLELQQLYEAILEIKIDKPNFRRKMMKMDLLVPCNEKQVGVAHRAASLYRFDEENYDKLCSQGFSFEF